MQSCILTYYRLPLVAEGSRQGGCGGGLALISASLVPHSWWRVVVVGVTYFNTLSTKLLLSRFGLNSILFMTIYQEYKNVRYPEIQQAIHGHCVYI